MKKKRLIRLLLVLCMAFTLLPTAALAAEDTLMPAGSVFQQLKQSPFTFAGGSGTREDPYLVSTPDQLNAIRQGLDKHYRLANDIDLSGWGNWLPIGGEVLNRYGEAAPFTGSFDGAGHVISGMTITGTRADFQPAGQRQGHEAHYFGLFGHVQSRTTEIDPGDAYEDATLGGVSNLGIVNYTINIDSPRDISIGFPYIGVADFIDNVYNAGSLNAPSTSQIYSGTVKLGVGHAGERFLKDENWVDSPTLNRKVLAVLREDELTGTPIVPVLGVGKFLDVQPTDFFADAVLWAVNRKVTSGTSDTTFSPDATCTRGQIVTFLHRAYKDT